MIVSNIKVHTLISLMQIYPDCPRNVDHIYSNWFYSNIIFIMLNFPYKEDSEAQEDSMSYLYSSTGMGHNYGNCRSSTHLLGMSENLCK